jgi:hypothetical protein
MAPESFLQNQFSIRKIAKLIKEFPTLAIKLGRGNTSRAASGTQTVDHTSSLAIDENQRARRTTRGAFFALMTTSSLRNPSGGTLVGQTLQKLAVPAHLIFSLKI